MEKPKGGRGQKASYQTKVVRLPLKVAKYADHVGDNARTLISSGRDESSLHYSALESSQAIDIARQILSNKKSAKESLKNLLQELYGTDIEL